MLLHYWQLRSLTLYYPIYESTGEEGMFMLGTLCCDSHPLHETPASQELLVDFQ